MLVRFDVQAADVWLGMTPGKKCQLILTRGSDLGSRKQ